MSEKPQRLSELVGTFAPEGANDRRWHFVEHQLEQANISAGSAVSALKDIANRPENDNEFDLAHDCLSIAHIMLRHILEARASFLSYLSDTDVPERISRKEL